MTNQKEKRRASPYLTITERKGRLKILSLLFPLQVPLKQPTFCQKLTFIFFNYSFPTPDHSVPDLCYHDIAGIDEVIQEVIERIEWPFLLPELYSSLGVSPAKGILLHGPTGCGKTMLANCIAGELRAKLKQNRNEDLTYFRIPAPELISGLSGESENNIRILFEQAKVKSSYMLPPSPLKPSIFSKKCEPCIIFLDEIDSITSKREQASKDMERRIVSQLISSFDGLAQCQRVIVFGATNRSDSLDPSLRSGGRFEREISLGVYYN